MPPACGATELKQFRGTIVESQFTHQLTEVIMEIALIPAIFVGIFATIAAAILWFPYDK
jgi:hypothetical protein